VVIVVYCFCSVEENLWPTGSPIAKPATSANGSNCLYKLTVTQFVGFRGTHASVAITQLCGILVMTVIRAGLRRGRLGKEKNLAGKLQGSASLRDITSRELD